MKFMLQKPETNFNNSKWILEEASNEKHKQRENNKIYFMISHVSREQRDSLKYKSKRLA